MLERQSLPAKRKCWTRTIKVNNQTVHFTVGEYNDGRPGELWIDVSKAGSAVRAWAGASAKLISLMLQYGIPMSEMVDALAGHCTEAFGEVQVDYHEEITSSVGILDAIIRSMALEYLARNIAEGYECESESLEME
jgi:ribonucleoside-diphosphate reductase alpha chain